MGHVKIQPVIYECYRRDSFQTDNELSLRLTAEERRDVFFFKALADIAEIHRHEERKSNVKAHGASRGGDTRAKLLSLFDDVSLPSQRGTRISYSLLTAIQR